MGFHDFDGSVPLITLDYTEVPAITQGFGTDITNVNPYAVINAAGVIQLTPSDDVWIDDQQIIVGNARNIVNAADIFGFWRSMRIRPGMWWTVSRFVRAQVRLEEEWIEGFSRASTITVNGSQYTPNSDNLALLFDGVSYALTPVPPTLPGTEAGTVKTDNEGRFEATFDLPSGVPGGSKPVVVSNITNRGENQFVIGHRRRTTVFETRVIRRIDPVAQSFPVIAPECYTSVDLFFASKDASLPLVVSLQSMQNGYPGRDVLAQAVVQPANVQISNDGSLATHITFDRPALCEADR